MSCLQYHLWNSWPLWAYSHQWKILLNWGWSGCAWALDKPWRWKQPMKKEAKEANLKLRPGGGQLPWLPTVFQSGSLLCEARLSFIFVASMGCLSTFPLCSRKVYQLIWNSPISEQWSRMGQNWHRESVAQGRNQCLGKEFGVRHPTVSAPPHTRVEMEKSWHLAYC